METKGKNKVRPTADNYWKVLDSLNTGILIAVGNRNVRANKAFCKLSGYKQDELLGKTPRFLIPEDNIAILDERAERKNAGRRVPSVFEIQVLHKSGKRIDVRTHSKDIIFNNDPAVLYEFEDVTERNRAQKKLIESKEELEALVKLRTKDLLENVKTLEKTKNELAESRNMINNILDNIPQRVFWKDKKSNYLGCNKQFAQDAGLTEPQDIVGKTDFELFNREDAKRYRKDDKYVITTGKRKINLEEPQTRKNDEVSWLRTNKLPLKSSSGEIIGVLGTYEDITEKKAAEDKLRKSEERYSLVSEATNHGIWDWDVESDTVYLSPQWKKQIGYQDDELENKFSTWQNQLHPDDYEKSHETLNSYLKNPEGLFEMEFRMRHKNGSYRWIFSRAASVKNKRGKVVRMFGAHTDITAFKLAEEQLLLSESRYKTLFDSVAEPIVISDWRGNIKEVNKEAVKQYGYTRQEFLSLSADKIVRKDYHPVLFKWLSELQASGEAYAETIDIRKDGTEICTEVHGKKIQYGGESHVLAILRDVTDTKKLTDELAKYRQQLELVLNSVPVLISYLDENLIYQFVNKGYEEWFRVKSEEIIGRHPREIIGDKAFKLIEADLKEVLRGEVVHRERSLPLNKAGTKHVQTTYLPHIVNNKAVGIIICVNDITEVTTVQNKLKTKTADLRLINDVSAALHAGKELETVFEIVNSRTAEYFFTKGTSGASIFTYDPETKILEARVNPMKSEFIPKLENLVKIKLPKLNLSVEDNSFVKEVMFGSQPVYLQNHEQINRWIEEFINDTWLKNKLIKKSLKKFIPKIREMLGIETMYILPLAHNDVPIGLMEVSHQKPFTNEEQARLVSIASQLSAAVYQRYLRDEVDENERRLSNAIKYAPFPIMIHADDGEVLQVSDAWKEITGFDSDEIATISDWAAKTAAKSKEGNGKDLSLLYKFGENKQHLGEFEILCKDGKTVVWDFSNSFLGKLPDGRKLGISMAMDITARKASEGKLRRTMRELAKSNEELEQFAYVASHDLQEPLRMVASFTQLLNKRYNHLLDQDGKDYIHFAVDGANRMQELISDLLDLSRITTRGKEFEKVNLSEPAKGAAALLKERLDSTGTVLTIGNLPTVKCDSSQLQRVFQNLISNAIKFRTDNSPKISIYAKNKGKYWQISVKDNGIGIDKKFHERIFVIFQRLHNRDKYSGTGIGLAVAARIIDRHGGKIWVESEPGKGATFHFTLLKEV